MSIQPQVLVVDDSPINLKLARVALEGGGYAVEVANDGLEAWELLSRYRPALILMDLQMPGLDGFELTRRIKADPDKSYIKIIAVTAYAMKGDRDRALAAGCDGYISKPIDPLLLPGLIASHLGVPDVTRIGDEAADPILIIEDNPTSRKLIRVTLESEGYSVQEFGEARAALSWLTTGRARMIIQDLILPDMDGLDLLDELRTSPSTASLPIICLSGFLTRMQEAQVRSLRFSAQLAKPIDPIQLLDAVRGQLDKTPSVRPPYVPPHSLHVLVVDDDPLQRKLAEYHLSGVGFTVTTVDNAALAIERASSVRPDAIISDVLMPDLNGYELCLSIRKHPQLASIPVILISSHYVQESDRKLAERVGANAFVDRAGDWMTALECVRDVLSRPSTTRASHDTEELRRAIQRSTTAQLQHQLRVNAELMQQCLLDAAQLSVLAGVSDSLARSATVQGVLVDVLTMCLDIAGISKGALYLSGDAGFTPKHWLGFSASEAEALRDFFGHSELLSDLVRTSQVSAIPSAAVSGELAQELLQAAGVSSVLIVRVAWGDATHGALLLGARDSDITTQEPATFARVLGGQMGQAIGLADAFERLAASEQRFRTLVASMDDVTVSDVRGRVSGVYGRAWQLQPSRYIGKALSELPGPGESAQQAQAYARACSGESVSFEWSRGSGIEARHYQDSMWPVHNAHNEVISVMRVRRDISAEKRLQAQVMTADRMVSVGMLAAGVAHEINNPLMAVLGNLEIVRNSLSQLPHAMEDLMEALDDSIEGGKRVEAIVRDLRLFSRAEDERSCGVDLDSVLASTLRLARNEIKHRARLVQDIRARPKVRGNESRLGQVFLNLIVNAAQAIPEGHADTNEIRLGMRLDQQGRAVVEISDTGCGIPSDTARQLFVPFVTTKPVGVGTGLGLSICHRIVTSIGGEIGFESQVGRGTTFRVTLPVDTSSPSPQKSVVPAMRRTSARGRIVVIDDDVSICNLLKRLLQHDHDILTFVDGSAALATLERDRNFDIILCDLMMPIVSGCEFYERLRLVAPELAERTVFLTGGAFTEEARLFLDRVPNTHVTKPFEITALRALISERMVRA